MAYQPVPQGGYPPQQGGYPPPQNGYPPPQGGYPPQQGGYPPPQNGYPPPQGGGNPPNKCIMIVCIIFGLEFVAVYLKDGKCSKHVWINILLCFLFYFPAVIHAIWYCFCRN